MKNDSSATKTSNTDGYPPQRHAGKVGYGPNYNVDAGIVDEIEGLAEEMVGKVAHNPNLIHKGHELHTGELKRRELLGISDSAKDPLPGSGNNPKSTIEAHPSNQSNSSTTQQHTSSDSKVANDASVN